MSADNWTKCPKCEAIHEQEIENARDIVSNKYGVVDKDTYLKAKSVLDTEYGSRGWVGGDTLREDYEIGIWCGEFEVSYQASCEVCGFKFEYKFNRSIENDSR